jgi:hypothetical protein
MKYTTMKKWLALKTAGIITTSMLLVVPLVSHSQTETTPPPTTDYTNILNGMNTKLQSILEELKAFHGDVIEDLAKFFETKLDFTGLVGNRAAYKLSNDWIIQDSASETNTDTRNSLLLTQDEYYQTIAESANTVNVSLSSDDDTGNYQKFSISSILDNFSLQEDSPEMQNARYYIQFLSGKNNPVMPPTPNMNTDHANEKIPVQQYKAALGAFTAAQSVALNTLYKALAARTVQKDLGKTAGMDKNDASPLEIQQHLAKQSFSDSWAEKVLTEATPADIQRQQLFLLASIQNLLFENRLQMEQINVNLAALILQAQQDATRKGLSAMRTQAIRSLR